MKVLALALALTIGVGPVARAADPLLRGEIEGKPVLLFADGFWRFDDAVGEICTRAGSHGEVCALPSDWSRLPDVDQGRAGLPEFVRDAFTAEFRVLQPFGGESLTVKNAMAFIGNQSMDNGVRGTVLSTTESAIAGFGGGQVVIASGTRGVMAFTFALQNGRLLIARTREQGTTLFSADHAAAHDSFVAALRPAPFE